MLKNPPESWGLLDHLKISFDCLATSWRFAISSYKLKFQRSRTKFSINSWELINQPETVIILMEEYFIWRQMPAGCWFIKCCLWFEGLRLWFLFFQQWNWQNEGWYTHQSSASEIWISNFRGIPSLIDSIHYKQQEWQVGWVWRKSIEKGTKYEHHHLSTSELMGTSTINMRA